MTKQEVIDLTFEALRECDKEKLARARDEAGKISYEFRNFIKLLSIRLAYSPDKKEDK